MTFDVHAHVIVPEITASDEPWRPRVYRDDAGAQVVEMGGRQIRAAIAEFVDIDGILAAQDEAGVERVLLCPWVPLLYYDAEPDEGLRRARIQNEALAGLVRRPPRARGGARRAAAPGPGARGRELRALMEGGVLSGVEVAASVRGVFLGDDRFEPFWEAAEATGAAGLRPSHHARLRLAGVPGLLPLEHRGEPARDGDHGGAHGRGRA